MSIMIKRLERLIQTTSPAQVAVWLNYSDPRPILQWIIRGQIPRSKIPLVEDLLNKKGLTSERIIRRPKRQETSTN